MDRKVFIKLLHRRSFQPFRIIIAERVSYDVKHPDLMIVGETAATVSVPSENAVNPMARENILISLRNVTRVMPIPR